MSNNESNGEKIYAILCTFFAIIVIISNLVYKKIVYIDIFHICSLEISAGAIFYPLTFIINDIVTEFYGKAKAKFCAIIGAGASGMIAIMLTILNNLEAANWSELDDKTFNLVFGSYGLVFIGSIVASYLGQIANIFIYLILRKLINSKFILLETILGTIISLFIDTSIIITFMVVLKIFPVHHAKILLISNYLFKIFFTCVSTIILFVIYRVVSFWTKEKT